MKVKSPYVRPEYKSGMTRLKRRFAFLPVLVSDEILWLEFYEVLQVWKIDEEELVIEDKKVNFFNGFWKDISKRTCQ